MASNGMDVAEPLAPSVWSMRTISVRWLAVQPTTGARRALIASPEVGDVLRDLGLTGVVA